MANDEEMDNQLNIDIPDHHNDYSISDSCNDEGNALDYNARVDKTILEVIGRTCDNRLEPESRHSSRCNDANRDGDISKTPEALGNAGSLDSKGPTINIFPKVQKCEVANRFKDNLSEYKDLLRFDSDEDEETAILPATGEVSVYPANSIMKNHTEKFLANVNDFHNANTGYHENDLNEQDFESSPIFDLTPPAYFTKKKDYESLNKSPIFTTQNVKFNHDSNYAASCHFDLELSPPTNGNVNGDMDYITLCHFDLELAPPYKGDVKRDADMDYTTPCHFDLEHSPPLNIIKNGGFTDPEHRSSDKLADAYIDRIKNDVDIMNRGDRSIPSNVNNPNELFDDKNNDSINDLLADKYPTNHNDKPLDVSSDLFADECEDDLMGLNLESNDAQILAKSDKIENPNHDTFPHLNSNFDLNFSFDENFESNNHLPLSKPKNGTNINNDQSKINKDTEIESKFDILDEDISEEDITMCAHISKNTYFSTDVDIDKVGSDMIGVDKKNEMGSNNVSGNKLDISSNFDLMGIDSTLDRHEFSAVDAQVINEEKVYGSCFDLGLGNDRDNYHVKEELNQQIENDLDKVKPIVKNLETKGESGVKASKGATLPASAKIIQKDNVLYSSFDLGLDEDASIFQNLNIDYDNNNQKMKNDDNKLDKSPSYFQRATENIETRDGKYFKSKLPRPIIHKLKNFASENNITILKTPNNSHKIKLSPDFMPKKHSTPFADKKRILATLSSNKKNEYESQNENESEFTREKGTHKSRDDDNIVNDFGSDSDHFIREKVTHKSDDDDNIVNNPGSDNDLEDSFLEVKKNKRKSNKRQNKCVSKKQILKFLDLEAQVDGSASGSDTGLENDEELDNTMLDSFVVRPNSSKYYEGVESESKMEAVYLKSTKNIQGMYGNKFKIKISNNNKQVSYIYSQFPDTQERQETYNQDSFCVDNNMEKSEYDTNHFLTDNEDEYNSIVTHKETSCSKVELPTPGFIQISSSDDSHINVGNKNNRRNDKTKVTKRRHNNFVDSDHHEDKDTVISDATDFSIDDESKNIIYKLDSRSKPRVFDKPVPLPRRGYRKFVILPAESKKGPNFITITDDSEDNLIPPKPRNKKYNRIKPLKNGSDSSLEN